MAFVAAVVAAVASRVGREDEVGEVVDQRERPGVFGRDLVLRGELEAVLVEGGDGGRAEGGGLRALGRGGGGGGGLPGDGAVFLAGKRAGGKRAGGKR